MKKTFFTTDYGLFGSYPFNREIVDDNKVAALMEEMQKNGYDEFQPLIVSVSLKVADGQHRLEAAKRLGIGIWVDKYDREFTPDEIRRMNKHRTNWTMADFLHSMIEDENVQRLYSFVKTAKKEGIASSSAIRIAMAANQKDQVRNVDKGITEAEEAKAVAFLSEVKELSTWIAGTKKFAFIGAYARAKKCPNFDYDTFRKKVSQVKFDGRGRISDLADEIERVYNYRLRDEDRINIPREGIRKY